MRYAMRPALAIRSILLCVMLALPACVGAPPIVAASSACSSLLPPEWERGVPGAPLPNGEAIGDWVAFSDAQTAQLDKANERYVAGVGIVQRCEARDAAAVEAARKRWWQFWR